MSRVSAVLNAFLDLMSDVAVEFEMQEQDRLQCFMKGLTHPPSPLALGSHHQPRDGDTVCRLG